jgi:hypothetical protein
MSIDNLLQNDDGVESLTEWQVKDVWCRMQLAHYASRALTRHPNENMDVIEKRLQEMHSGYLKDLAVRVFEEEADCHDALSWEDDRDNIDRLFEVWTKEPEGDTSTVEVARERIKTTLRGCGMARMKVARGRVSYHTEN